MRDKDKLRLHIKTDNLAHMHVKVKLRLHIKTDSQEHIKEQVKLRLHIKTGSQELMLDKVKHQLLGGITHYLNNGLQHLYLVKKRSLRTPFLHS
jgi:hypothetical protein